MAAMAAGSSCAAAGLDSEYVRMDFKSWDLTFALRSHAPAANRHARGLSAGQAKGEVFHSPRLQRIMQEVGASGCVGRLATRNSTLLPAPPLYHLIPARTFALHYM